MSEYQYYEFQAVDRPLSEDQMRALRALSTRARITATSFVNHYDWGSFKGSPRALMEGYFDLFLYLANWGTRWFMVRLPRRFLDSEAAALYCVAKDACAAWTTDDHIILEFARSDLYGDDLEDYEFDDGRGWLAALAPLRDELLHGDLRGLYLGWLFCVEDGLVDEGDVEPPVPPGLHSLSGSLQAFADFMALDQDLLAVAIEAGGTEPPADPSHSELEGWVRGLSDDEKIALVVRLAEGDDPNLGLELRRRCEQALVERDRAALPTAARRRSAGELLAAAERRAAERARLVAEREAAERARREREAAIARAKRLNALAARGDAVWNEVEALVDRKRPDDYDRAVELLKDLRALAERDGTAEDFARRIRELRARHARKPSFLDRLDQAGLVAESS